MGTILSILKWITFATVGLVALAFVLLAYLMSSRLNPNFDDDDPRYQTLVSRLAEIGQSLEPDGGHDVNKGIDLSILNIDLSTLNNGNWTTACMFGGYNDPLEEMIERGANVSDEDKARLSELEGGFRLAQVEESEVMFAFIDLTGRAQFIHFQHNIGPGGQHLKKCITKPQTVIDLRDA